METKVCTICEEELPATTEYFHTNKTGKYGLRSQCIICRKPYHKQYNEENKEQKKDYNKQYIKENKEVLKTYRKQYYEENKEIILIDRQQYYEENKEQHSTYMKQYYEENKEQKKDYNKQYNEDNKEELKDYRKKYYEINKECIISKSVAYERNRRKNDIGYRVLKNCRGRLRRAVKRQDKSASTKELIGCSVEYLLEHLENQFQEGMSWDNYGEWHIDHIKPCALFDFTKEEEQRECFNYTNLQPLWAEDNLKKGANY